MKSLDVIGIDVSKKTMDVCALFNDKLRKQAFENTEVGHKSLANWIGKLGLLDPHVCMEATGCYSERVAEFLHEGNVRVNIVNPFQIKSFRCSKMVRQKTDSSAAEIIAQFCLQNEPTLWKPKSRINKGLHEINICIEKLKKELHQWTNLLEKTILNKMLQPFIDQKIENLKKSIQVLEKEEKRSSKKNPI